jgi:hypothetical protein
MEAQQTDITRQEPINNRGIVFSERSMLMSEHATMEYVMPPLNTVTEEWCFLCSPCRDVISREVSKSVSELVRRLLQFSCCELLLSEAGRGGWGHFWKENAHHLEAVTRRMAKIHQAEETYMCALLNFKAYELVKW